MELPIIVGIISLVTSLLITGFNAAMLIVVKFNDLKHLENCVTDLKKIIEINTNSINTLNTNFSAIDARCEERHKK